MCTTFPRGISHPRIHLGMWTLFYRNFFNFHRKLRKSIKFIAFYLTVQSFSTAAILNFRSLAFLHPKKITKSLKIDRNLKKCTYPKIHTIYENLQKSPLIESEKFPQNVSNIGVSYKTSLDLRWILAKTKTNRSYELNRDLTNLDIILLLYVRKNILNNLT